MKQKRLLRKIPPLGDLSDYSKDWFTWWNSVQPDWRRMEAGQTSGQSFSLDVPDNETWTELAHGGRNGLSLFILTVAWWKHACIKADVSTLEVDVAIDDMTFVLQSMADKLSAPVVTGSKRKATGPAAPRPKRSKKAGKA